MWLSATVQSLVLIKLQCTAVLTLNVSESSRPSRPNCLKALALANKSKPKSNSVPSIHGITNVSVQVLLCRRINLEVSDCISYILSPVHAEGIRGIFVGI
jgi:hypothetical protein